MNVPEAWTTADELIQCSAYPMTGSGRCQRRTHSTYRGYGLCWQHLQWARIIDYRIASQTAGGRVCAACLTIRALPGDRYCAGCASARDREAWAT